MGVYMQVITAFSSLGATLKSVTMNYTAPADAIYNVIISKGYTLLTVLFHIIKASLFPFFIILPGIYDVYHPAEQLCVPSARCVDQGHYQHCQTHCLTDCFVTSFSLQ